MLHLILYLRPYAKYLLIFTILSIITVSSLPSINTPRIETGRIEIRLDYFFHLAEYGGLAFFSFLTAARNDFHIRIKSYIIITLCLIAFSVLDEFHQKFIPGRTFNYNDILSNILGVITGLGFCVISFRSLHKNKQAYL